MTPKFEAAKAEHTKKIAAFDMATEAREQLDAIASEVNAEIAALKTELALVDPLASDAVERYRELDSRQSAFRIKSQGIEARLSQARHAEAEAEQDVKVAHRKCYEIEEQQARATLEQAKADLDAYLAEVATRLEMHFRLCHLRDQEHFDKERELQFAGGPFVPSRKHMFSKEERERVFQLAHKRVAEVESARRGPVNYEDAVWPQR